MAVSTQAVKYICKTGSVIVALHVMLRGNNFKAERGFGEGAYSSHKDQKLAERGSLFSPATQRQQLQKRVAREDEPSDGENGNAGGSVLLVHRAEPVGCCVGAGKLPCSMCFGLFQGCAGRLLGGGFGGLVSRKKEKLGVDIRLVRKLECVRGIEQCLYFFCIDVAAGTVGYVSRNQQKKYTYKKSTHSTKITNGGMFAMGGIVDSPRSAVHGTFRLR